MHMSDALLSPAVAGITGVASAGALVYAIKKMRRESLDEGLIPVMGVMGAFVFAAQMINFTIPGTGSSGHIGGGILLSAILGPLPALLVLSAVLVIQCLFFADGGLMALGCNIFNMGVCACLVGYPLLFRPVVRRRVSPGRLMGASVLTVMAGLQLGAFGVVVQTTLSGVAQLPFGAFLALMQPIHLAIGLVEGLVTGGVLCFIQQVRPTLLECTDTHARGGVFSPKAALGVLLATAVVLGGGVSLLASSHPDGLEWSIAGVAGELETMPTGESLVHEAAQTVQDTTAILPGYGFKSAEGEGSGAGTSVSGIAGGALTLLLAGACGTAISKIRKRTREKTPS